MRRYGYLFAILLLVLVFTLKVDVVYANDLEAEFKAACERDVSAWNNRDIDAIIENGAEAMGFDYRTEMITMNASVDKELNKALVEAFLSDFEKYEWIVESYETKVIANTGIACGFFAENTKPKNGELKTVRGRFSTTYVKKDGKWKCVLFHRDIQFAKK